MNIKHSLEMKIKMGYWPGYSIAMYPSQFVYKPINVELNSIWKNHNEINLYFHIPFCQSICPYCGFFTIVPQSNSIVQQYKNKLYAQLDFYLNALKTNVNIKSICFGGGTPNLIPIFIYYELFDRLTKSHVQFDANLEPSMEISPEVIDYGYIQELKNIGIQRLSLGIQSLDTSLRGKIGRKNNYCLEKLITFIHSINLNVNVDLMSGLVGQTSEMFMETLINVTKLKPESISIYPLAGQKSTIQKSDVQMSNRERYSLFGEIYDYLNSQGYYCESSIKFVLKGQKSTHQQKKYEYMGIDTLGIGCAARSYNFYTHYGLESGFNIKNRLSVLNEYINKPFEDLQWYGVHMNHDERRCRFIIYGLFSGNFNTLEYLARFKSDFEKDYDEVYHAMLDLELIESKNSIIYLTKKGITYSDIICMQFWSENTKNLFTKSLL